MLLKNKKIRERNPHYFELRSWRDKNRYKSGYVLKSIMCNSIPLANVEENQKFDEVIVHRLAKVIEVLIDIEN